METGSVSIFFLIHLFNTMVAVCKGLGWGKSHILVSNKVKFSECIMHTVTIVLSKNPIQVAYKYIALPGGMSAPEW